MSSALRGTGVTAVDLSRAPVGAVTEQSTDTTLEPDTATTRHSLPPNDEPLLFPCRRKYESPSSQTRSYAPGTVNTTIHGHDHHVDLGAAEDGSQEAVSLDIITEIGLHVPFGDLWKLWVTVTRSIRHFW